MPEIGHTRWAISEGYIPSGSLSHDHAVVSHEALCLLNAGDRDAETDISGLFVVSTTVAFSPSMIRASALASMERQAEPLELLNCTRQSPHTGIPGLCLSGAFSAD